MIKVICVSINGCGATQEYDNVEGVISSDDAWYEDYNYRCEIYATVVEEEILVLEYTHNELDDSDMTWIILKSSVTEDEWNQLISHYIVD